MIAYGCAIGDVDKYRRCARPGIDLARAEAATPVIELHGADCIFGAYNEILERVRGDDGVDALVLVHEDTEITDARFEEKVRRALAETPAAILGVLGAVGVTGIDWWVHERTIGAAVLKAVEPWPGPAVPLIGGETLVGPGGVGEVDALDGMILVLSRWAIDNLRFDETLGPGFHGYDIDVCFQARELGGHVQVVDFGISHHQNSIISLSHRAAWKRAHIAFRRKWESRWPLRPPARDRIRPLRMKELAGPAAWGGGGSSASS